MSLEGGESRLEAGGPEAALKLLLEVFHGLAIPYLVTGSLASSVHGVARHTKDIDLVADIKPDRVAPLAAGLQREFEADPVLIDAAIRTGRGFHLTHLSSGYTFGISPLSSDPYQQVQFARREAVPVPLGGSLPLELFVETAEDTVLSKLLSFQSEGGVLKQQWQHNILGVVRVTRGLEAATLAGLTEWQDALAVARVHRQTLDLDYLRQWARHRCIEDLLERLLGAL